ncbi:sigma-70 family RNA polymerase sigma factor [Planctomycetes bacterium CA13]
MNPQKITETLLQQRLSLTSYVYSVCRNYHLAEDVFQEMCVKAVSERERFTSKDHLVNWFRVSSRNRAIDIIRTREGRYVGLSTETLDLLEENWTEAGDSWRELRFEALAQCMEMLTPRSQEIVKLRYFENRSGGEIASFIGGKVESAYQLISRIHKTLGNCISQRLEMESQ